MIEDQIEALAQDTTVVWVECADHGGVVAGEKKGYDRFFTDQGNPKDFTSDIEPHWQRIFESFGTRWDENRETYRLLYDTMRTFFVSFQGLRINKVASHEVIDSDASSEEKRKRKIFLADLATSHLIQMYMSGKKAIDLMEKLKIPHDTYTASKLKETRNKLLEHNHNPRGILKDLILEPDFWSVMATSSYLPVNIHTSKEKEYIAYFDYYQDYYDLEEIFYNAINKHKPLTKK